MVLRDPNGYTVGGKQLWANGYLPALYQGVEFSMRGAPVHHLNPPEPLPPGSQRASLDYLAKLNEAHLRDHPGESELEARIHNFELAARMQLAAGDVLDLSKETEATKKLYGMDNPLTAELRHALPDGAAAGRKGCAIRASHRQPGPAVGSSHRYQGNLAQDRHRNGPGLDGASSRT